MPYSIYDIDKNSSVTEKNKKLTEKVKFEKNFFEKEKEKVTVDTLIKHRDSLNGMLELLSANHTVSGTVYYADIETMVDETVAYLDNLILKTSGKKYDKDEEVSYEGFAAMMGLLSSQATRYLEYKAPDMSIAGDSSTEINRVYAAAIVHDIARNTADEMNAIINSNRENNKDTEILGAEKSGLHNPGQTEFVHQYRKIDELEKELSGTTGMFHGSGEQFDAMMAQLKVTREKMLEALQQSKTPDKDQECMDAMYKLRSDVKEYLQYKKFNNDFGTTSMNRMRAAGKLDKFLDQTFVPMAERAERWFEDMSNKLKEEKIDISNPFTASEIVILDDAAVSLDDENKIPSGDYKKRFQMASELTKSRHLAFAKIGNNGETLHPYDYTENMADWINREFPHSKEEFTPEHKLHLYNMARQNRLFIHSSILEGVDDFVEKRIAVDSQNGCAVQNLAQKIDMDGRFKDTADYKNFSMTEVQLKKMHERSQKANFNASIRPLTQDAHIAMRDQGLKPEEISQYQKGHDNYFTNYNLGMVAKYYPDWFKNAEDAHELGEMARIYTDFGHFNTEEDNKIIEKTVVFWDINKLKQSDKNFLQKLKVKSFGELLNAEIKNSDGEVIKAETSYRLAKKIFTDLVNNKDVMIDGKRFEMRGNSINTVEAVPQEQADIAKRYFDKMDDWTKRVIDSMAPQELKEKFKTGYDAAQAWFDVNSGTLKGFEKMALNTCLNIKGALDGLKKDRDARNRQIGINDINEAVKKFMPSDSKGMIGAEVLPKKMPVIDNDHLNKLRFFESFRDLMDQMKRGVKDPSDMNSDMEHRIASRIVTVAAEMSIRMANANGGVNKGMSEGKEVDFRAQSMDFLLKPDTRAEAIEDMSKCGLIRNAIKNGTAQELLNMSDGELARAYEKSEVEEMARENAAKKHNLDKAANKNNKDITAQQNAELNV